MPPTMLPDNIPRECFTRTDEDAAAYQAAIEKYWPALSIHQPWASLIVGQYKLIENRTWQTKYRGPLLIQASKNTKLIGDYHAARREGYELPETPPLGAIVGVALVRDCVQLADLPRGWRDDPFAEGPWCWCLGGVVKFAEPIICGGMQQLFNVKRETLDEVKRRVAAHFEFGV